MNCTCSRAGTGTGSSPGLRERNHLQSSTNQPIEDHIVEENHVNDWEGAKILDRDSNQFTRKIREAIWIRRRPAGGAKP